jgi:hypothetical protein
MTPKANLDHRQQFQPTPAERAAADSVTATRQVLSELRHASADLIRRWNAAHPAEAATGSQSGSQSAGNGVVPLAHENPLHPVLSTTEEHP